MRLSAPDAAEPGSKVPDRLWCGFGWLARSRTRIASTLEVEPAAKRRKKRKEGKSSSEEAARAAGLTYPTQHVLLDLELWGAEIDQQAVLNPRGTQEAQDLGHRFVRQGLGCFQTDIVGSFLLRLLRLFAAERLSPPVPSDDTGPLYAGGGINAGRSGG